VLSFRATLCDKPQADPNERVNQINRRNEKFFLSLQRKIINSHAVGLSSGLCIVGPPPIVWKVLRDTDGERFVVMNKGYGFSGEFVSH
jgi:hypothetical protein